MNNLRNGFTMIELIFVIVVLGILSAVAIPKFAATRTDAEIAKARSDIASVRAAIVTERQTRLLRGDSKFINKLHSADDTFFDGNGTATLLMYGIKAKNSDASWQETPNDKNTTDGKNVWEYTFKILDSDNIFEYKQENGTFICTSGDYCSDLTE